MPVHTAASILSSVDTTHFVLAALGVAGLGWVKQKMGGRTCTWERDWAGKMILIIVRGV
jgi:hypothetical protein